MASCLLIRCIKWLRSSGVAYGVHSARGGYHMGGMSKFITTAHMILLLDILQCRSCTFSCLPRLPTKCRSRGIFQSRLPVTILRSTVSISITKVRQMKYNVICSLTHTKWMYLQLHWILLYRPYSKSSNQSPQAATTKCWLCKEKP